MAGPEPLTAWLHDVPVATIEEVRTGKLTLQHTEAALDRWPRNRPVLSVSLPLQPERYPPGVATPFLEGLLPEGEARTRIEQLVGVRRGDTHGLLGAIGRDCAGAVVIQPRDALAPADDAGDVRWLDEAELDDAITSLPEHPLGVADDVRVSLAGLQTKLLVVRHADGTFGLPRHGHPSTHLLKPEDQRYPAMAANEAFCLRVAAALGLTSVVPEVIDVAGRPVLVVPRYDRVQDGDGRVRRLHQEDCCQALAIDTSRPDTKYEEFGGPSLRSVADVLDRFSGRAEELDHLVSTMVLTVAIGNADAHGRNLSLLHRDGAVVLAPLYDLVSTIHYPTVSTPDGERPVSTSLAMRINGRRSIHEVTVDDLVAEAASWHYGARRARNEVDRSLDELPDAVAAAADATATLPDAVAEVVLARTAALLRDEPAGGSAR